MKRTRGMAVVLTMVLLTAACGGRGDDDDDATDTGSDETTVDNGGATSMGVTKEKVVVVNYIPDYGAEVNAILRAQGLYYDAEDAKVMNEAFSGFINGKYNLHGRKLEIITYQGTCRTVPPDLPCLIGEMNTIAKRYKRYVKRLYPYNFFGTDCDRNLRFDAGLIRGDGSTRPAYNTLKRAMRNFKR